MKYTEVLAHPNYQIKRKCAILHSVQKSLIFTTLRAKRAKIMSKFEFEFSRQKSNFESAIAILPILSVKIQMYFKV